MPRCFTHLLVPALLGAITWLSACTAKQPVAAADAGAAGHADSRGRERAVLALRRTMGRLRAGAVRHDARRVGRRASEPVHRLSHGQKQRVALAGALVSEPPLLLLDEPTSGLDPPGKRDLARMLRQTDAAMLVASHDLDFVTRLCRRVVLLEQGRVVTEQADASALRRRWEAAEVSQADTPPLQHGPG